MFHFKFSFCLVGLFISCSGIRVNAQLCEKTPELHGDIISLPVILINAYPFIPGNVNGVAGKFMFDTGFGSSLYLNDNLISLETKKVRGNGVVASGQSFITSTNDTIKELRLANEIIYHNLENINSANYGFLQQYISPDFLGYIGHEFYKGYLFKLDYLHRKITFYKSSAERSISKDFLANEKILAIIDFELKKLPNHPIVRLKIDGINVLGAFDTGQNGLLQLDRPSAKKLKSRGAIRVSGTDSSGDTLLSVKKIVFGRKFRTAMKGLELADLKSTQVVRRELNITEPNLLTIGYRFFSQYKTVWDYTSHKIYILAY